MDLLEEVLGAAFRRVPGQQIDQHRQRCEAAEQGDRWCVAGQGEQHRGARESDGQSQVIARLLGHGNGASAS